MKKILILSFITGFFVLWIGKSFASIEVLSLKSLIDEALTNNPQIKAAKFRVEAAKARVRLLRTLQDPRLEYEYDNITADMDAVMSGKTAPMRTFAISQEVPFPTKLVLRKQSAQKEANALEQEYKEVERSVVKDVKDAFFRLYLSHKKIAVTEENLESLTQFITIADKKYAAGQAKQQDVLRAQVEHSKLSNQLVLFEQEEKISQSLLNSLLNRSPGREMGIPEERKSNNLELDEEKIIQWARENRPELISFREMVKKSEIEHTLSKQEYLPDFMFKYKREERDGGVGSWAGMVGVTIPLWFWEKQNSNVLEAKANEEAARADYRAAENMVLFEAESGYAKFEAAQKLVKIYETGVLPQVQSAFETARLGYEADKIDSLELLDSLRALRDFELEYFEALANREMALADLERLVGVDLAKQSEVKDGK